MPPMRRSPLVDQVRPAIFPCVVLCLSVVLGSSRPVAAQVAVDAKGVPHLVDAVRRGDRTAVNQALGDARVDVNAATADGATALHWAVYADDAEMADRLIRAGAHVRAANQYGVTPLALACTSGNLRIVDRLLEAGADPNGAHPEGETPLMTAARAGSPAIVERLIAGGADVNAHERYRGQTALMWAAAQEHPDVVRVLVKRGARIGARSARGFSPLVFAVRTGNRETVDALLDAGAPVDTEAPDGSSALIVAIVNAHFELALHLLERGADPRANRLGWTPLHTLARVRRPDTVAMPNPIGRGAVDSLTLAQALLDRGADPNARATKAVPGIFTFLNTKGATPLLLAAQAVDLPLMRLLLDRGADPAIATETGTTPLLTAAGIGYDEGRHTWWTEAASLEAVTLLASLGAGVGVADAAGNTALHGAALTGANSVVRFLAERGARLDATNHDGVTPLSVAEGIHLGALYKVRPLTAAYIRELLGAGRSAGR